MAYQLTSGPLGGSMNVVGMYDNRTGQAINPQANNATSQYGRNYAQAPRTTMGWNNNPYNLPPPGYGMQAGGATSGGGLTKPLAGSGSATTQQYGGQAQAGAAYTPAKAAADAAYQQRLQQLYGSTTGQNLTGYAGGQPWNAQTAYSYNLAGGAGGSYGPGGGTGGYPSGAAGAYGSANLPGNMGGLLNLQMGENAWAKQQNQANWDLARNNLMGVTGRYQGDPLTQQARSNGLAMAQNYQLDPQDAINRASNLVNAASNSAQRAQMGDLAASGQLGGSAGGIAQDRLERARMAQLAQTGSDIQTQYGQLNFQRGLQATQQAQGLAGQASGLDMGVASTLIGNLPQYLPDDYSAYARLLAMNSGGGGGAAGGGGGYAGGGGGSAPAGSPLSGWLGMIGSGGGIKHQGGSTYAGTSFNDATMSGGVDQYGRPITYNASTGGVPQNATLIPGGTYNGQYQPPSWQQYNPNQVANPGYFDSSI